MSEKFEQVVDTDSIVIRVLNFHVLGVYLQIH